MPHRMTQSERVEYMLDTLNMTAAQFSKECGLTEATVSRWRSESCKISQSRANQIEDRFPQFSTKWIIGEDDHLNQLSSAFSGSLDRTHPGFVTARQILSAGGYSIETPFDRPNTDTGACMAFVGTMNDTMPVTVTRDDGTSCEMPLGTLESWGRSIISSACESFSGGVFKSAMDGTLPDPKPSEWVKVSPEALFGLDTRN